MVKNTQGGNKSKNLARKHMAGKNESRALRTSSCELECYGVVSQMNGFGMFFVVLEDGKTLLGRIRRNFRGKSKRDNHVCKGAVVLVGLREWEAPEYKEADLLEVYDPNEIKQLKKIPGINARALERYIETYGGGSGTAGAVDDDDTGIEFATDHVEEDYMAGLIPIEEDSGDVKKQEVIDFDEI
jgi:translation initiation factor IF-1